MYTLPVQLSDKFGVKNFFPELALENKADIFLLSPITVLEATDTEWMKPAKEAVARGYARLSAYNPSDRLHEADVYKTLCEDGYNSANRSTTLVALIDNNGINELAGTIRLVFGKDMASSDELPVLDAMNFVSFPTDWPHKLAGLPNNKAGELGRFTLVQSKESLNNENKTRITNALMTKALEITRLHGIEYVYGIMSSIVHKLMTNSDVETEYIQGYRLRDDYRFAHDIFERFPVYWRNSPKLYKFLKVNSLNN